MWIEDGASPNATTVVCSVVAGTAELLCGNVTYTPYAAPAEDLLAPGSPMVGVAAPLSGDRTHAGSGCGGCMQFFVYVGICVALVLFAGVFSGLTLGLLSLDPTTLQVLSMGGKPDEQRYAKRIAPLVKRHHLLLVTLLLSNATMMETLPLFLDKLVPTVVAIVISVTAVLLFGE